MHTVELIEEAVSLATRAGYRVRAEWLDGIGGGGCEINGRKVIFVDLALGPVDQLAQLVETLRSDPDVGSLPVPHQLRELLKVRKSA
jgi:hypothetical protein